MKLEIRDGHVIERVTHHLTPTEAYAVRGQLATQGIRVLLGYDVHHVLHIYALDPTSTEQEVQALRAFTAVTDAPVHWHQAVTAC